MSASGSPLDAGELADLFFCLAAAFLPPPAEISGADWCTALAEDLDEIGIATGLDTTAVCGRLRGCAASAGAREPWLVEYSRLFLVPPVKVTLNTGVYLEGSLAGVSAQMLSQCYAKAGLDRSDRFRDLPDHAAIQLEFVGALLDRVAAGDRDAGAMASDFIGSFLMHWVEPLRDACLRAAAKDASAQVFAALAEFVRTAAECVAR